MLDYRALLTEIAKLSPDTPALMEHMTKPEEYLAGAEFIRGIAREVGTEIR